MGRLSKTPERHIIFVLPSTGRVAYQISTIEALIASGHKITLISCKPKFPRVSGEEANYFRDIAGQLDELEAANPNFRVIYESPYDIHIRTRPRGPNLWHLLRSYASYLKRDPDNFYTRRWLGFMPDRLQRVATLARRILPLPGIGWALTRAERLSSADPQVVDWLAKVKVDAVVASPANTRGSEEAEYLQAAKKLGIRTAVPVLSWDNLTTKGLIPFAPELVLAWNDAHAVEAQTIHGIPQDRIVITGSPFFDKWFDKRLAVWSRRELEAKLGVPAAKPVLLYLGSSKHIALNEGWLVKQLAEAVANHPRLKDAVILVRPHPANDTMCRDLKDTPGLMLLPSAVPFSDDTTAAFMGMLTHAFAVVGINTSGLIDAIALDRPCYSIRTDQYTDTHLSAAHFRHLVAGDAIAVADDMDALLAELDGALKGKDARERQRREFVRKFLRPRGPSIAAGEIAANAVVMLSEGVDPRTINRELDLREPAPEADRSSPLVRPRATA
jgi:CDP-glycerol:poly(glycerophosphate) glycerophosphotransferase